MQNPKDSEWSRTEKKQQASLTDEGLGLGVAQRQNWLLYFHFARFNDFKTADFAASDWARGRSPCIVQHGRRIAWNSGSIASPYQA